MYDWPRPEQIDLDDSDEDEDMEYIEDITTNILLKSFNPDTKLKSHYDSLDIQYIKTKNNLMIHPEYIDIICKTRFNRHLFDFIMYICANKFDL